MKRIYYGGGSVVTGDRTADAVAHYAEALAMRETSDTIEIPIALDSGHIGRATFLIGPASQLVVVPEEGAPEQGEDEETIRDLEDRRARLANPKPQQSDSGVSHDSFTDAAEYTNADEGR